ncbi:MAG: hypothetical protein ACTSR2_01835 [Candidatus Hodarchaeales archaeon]
MTSKDKFYNTITDAIKQNPEYILNKRVKALMKEEFGEVFKFLEKVTEEGKNAKFEDVLIVKRIIDMLRFNETVGHDEVKVNLVDLADLFK